MNRTLKVALALPVAAVLVLGERRGQAPARPRG